MALDLMKRDPFADLTELHDRFNRLLEDTLRPTFEWGREGGSMLAKSWAPLVDVTEDANEMVIEAEVPGYKLEDIDIEVVGDQLVIKGHREQPTTETGKNYVRTERSYSDFYRALTFGSPIDASKVNATYKDGILRIAAPKSEDTKPKKVTVSAS